jgi:hypothetical protein
MRGEIQKMKRENFGVGKVREVRIGGYLPVLG